MFFINQMIQYRVARGKREWLHERSLKFKAELKTKKAELEKAKGPEDATKIQKEIAVLEERISSVIANAKDYQKRERFYQTALFNLIYTGYPAGLGGSPLPTLAALQQKPPVPGDANFVGPTQPSVIGRHEGPVSEVYIPPAGYLTPASR